MSDRTNINTLWIQDLKKEEKDKFVELLLNNTNNSILVKLKKLINHKRILIENEERNTERYSSNDWAYLQAHHNGMRQAYKICEDLLGFVQ